MKKSLFFVAAAALFAACSSDSENVDVPTLVNNADAISFSAYTGSAVTRGTVNTLSAFNENGIGVFAFYQPAASESAQGFNTYKFATPDFMYNQQVKPNFLGTYTADDAKSHNATLSGHKSAGEVQTPAVNYTAAEANAYNATLDGAAKAGMVITQTHKDKVNELTVGELFTQEQADAYNATLTNAVTTSTVKTAEVKYTDETAAAYNATLPGAIHEGDKYYGNVWSYSPVKYWPNNTNDQVSFFAYAPYSDDKQWEDMGIKTDVNGKKMVLTFPIYSEVTAQEDYLFAAPQLNQKKQDVTGNIQFPFSHITSQVNLFVGVEQDAASKVPTAWTDEKTTIEVKSIVFKNLSSSLISTYNLTADPITPVSSSSETKQDIELTSENFIATAATINKTNYTAAAFKQLNNTNSVMFLAPEALGDVVITYTVTTTDDDNAQNSSTITNTITTSLSSLTLAAGSSYKLDFLIGMTSVKVVASLTDWIDGGTTQYNVPANN